MIIVTGDLHFSANPRNAYRDAFIDWLYKYADKTDTTDIIILGDLTDAKDEHGAELVNRVVGHLHALSKQCRVHILTGNHDYVNAESPFFEFSRFIPNVTWYSKPTVETLGIGNCLFLPHTHNWKKEWPPHLKKRYIDYVFTHCTVEGATGGFGHKLHGVPLDVFKNQRQVISGDIHGPQKVGNVTYVGAPYTINFGDDYVGRILQIQNGKVESVRVFLPQKELLVADSLAELKIRAKHQLRKGDIIKVEYNLKQHDQERWYDIKREIKEWGEERDYVMDSIVPVMEIQTTSYKKVDVASDDALITTYAKSVQASPQTLARGLKLAARS